MWPSLNFLIHNDSIVEPLGVVHWSNWNRTFRMWILQCCSCSCHPTRKVAYFRASWLCLMCCWFDNYCLTCSSRTRDWFCVTSMESCDRTCFSSLRCSSSRSSHYTHSSVCTTVRSVTCHGIYRGLFSCWIIVGHERQSARDSIKAYVFRNESVNLPSDMGLHADSSHLRDNPNELSKQGAWHFQHGCSFTYILCYVHIIDHPS